MKKIFVLDTNVLIHNPQALFSFEDNEVVIPITVIEEIDNFKKGQDEKGRNARQIGRILDDLRKKGSLQDGVATPHDGLIKVTLANTVAKSISGYKMEDNNDNRILSTAINMKDKYPDKVVCLISKDANVRIKANALGIDSENYEHDKIKFDELYTGLSEKRVAQKTFDSLMKNNYLNVQGEKYYPNEFVKVYYKEDSILTRYNEANKTLYPLGNCKKGEIFGITPRNEEQRCALDLLCDENVKLVSLVGQAGTGKTLLAMAAGLNQVVEESKYTRLVVSRPIFPLGKDLGFLPGSKADKFKPWMQPIHDNMDILISGKTDGIDGMSNGKVFSKKRPTIEDYLDFGFIELEPLTYIRGRSLPNQYIVIDEAQNLSPHEMKTIITRAGEGTKIVLTGDPYQIDIPYLDSESNGLSTAVEKLKFEDVVGHVTLVKGERSHLADIAAKYFK